MVLAAHPHQDWHTTSFPFPRCSVAFHAYREDPPQPAPCSLLHAPKPSCPVGALAATPVISTMPQCLCPCCDLCLERPSSPASCSWFITASVSFSPLLTVNFWGGGGMRGFLLFICSTLQKVVQLEVLHKGKQVHALPSIRQSLSCSLCSSKASSNPGSQAFSSTRALDST